MDAKLEQLKAESHSTISEIKDQLKESGLEVFSLRTDLETCETNYEKEQVFTQRLNKDLNDTSQTLTTAQAELRKLTDLHNKITKKQTKDEEKIKFFEDNINKEIENQVGDIITQRQEMQKQTDDIRDLLA